MGMDKKYQAKHLPDEEFLAKVKTITEAVNRRYQTSFGAALIWDLEEAYPGFPLKVILAKAAALIKKGRLDGCTCGCRGDFRVVERRNNRD